MSSSTQNLAPIMPFIEPTEPIELPSVFGLESSAINQTSSGSTNPAPKHDQAAQNANAWKGKANAKDANPSSQHTEALNEHRRAASEEEATIEKTRMELERKISELNQLKNQLAQTEQRERELASRVAA